MCSEVGAFAGRLERVQQDWNMCSENCINNARSLRFDTFLKFDLERLQQGLRVCSKVGACAARLVKNNNKKYRFGAYVARLERVPQCWSVCSKLGACAARLVNKNIKKQRPPLSVQFHVKKLVVVVAVGGGYGPM